MNNANAWEVWWALLRFEEIQGAKRRPVIIIPGYEACLVCAKVTTHAPREKCVGEYEILKWKEAGLSAQSTIRCHRLYQFDSSVLETKIGDLDSCDILSLQAMLMFARPTIVRFQ